MHPRPVRYGACLFRRRGAAWARVRRAGPSQAGACRARRTRGGNLPDDGDETGDVGSSIPSFPVKSLPWALLEALHYLHFSHGANFGVRPWCLVFETPLVVVTDQIHTYGERVSLGRDHLGDAAIDALLSKEELSRESASVWEHGSPIHGVQSTGPNIPIT